MFKPDTKVSQATGESYTKTVALPEKVIKVSPVVDLEQVKWFLNFLAGSEPTPKFHWQAWDDNKTRKDKNLTYRTKNPRTFSKDLQKDLIAYNKSGSGVGVCINQVKGTRSNKNIKSIRALYVDYDLDTSENPFNQEPKPHVVIQTSPLRYHAYWKISDCSLEQFPLIQKALAIFCYGPGVKREDVDFGTCAAGGVMRCPGFIHQKAEPFLSRIVEVNEGPDYSVNDLIQAYGLILEPPKQEKPDTFKTKLGFSVGELLACIANNEIGDATIFKTVAMGKYCYDYPTGNWYLWNGNYWELDATQSFLNLMGEVVEAYQQGAQKLAFDKIEAVKKNLKDKADKLADQEKLLVQRIYALQGKKRIANVIDLSKPHGQGVEGLGIKGDLWDQKLYVLPCQNGLVDLNTGDFFKGEQSDFISLVAPHDFKGLNEPCPTWEAFLEQTIVDENLKTDFDTIDFLQKFLGMSLTGDVREHLFGVFWGAGRNGKGTLFETLKYVMGPLLHKFEGEMLLATGRPRDSAGARPDLVALRGKKLCWANEVEAGKKFNVATIKDLTGGDTVSCRQIYSHVINFKPTHTLCLSTNDKPKIPVNPTDPLWDRLLMFPFRLRFTYEPAAPHERLKDPSLREKLEKEASGILSWLVKGAIAWRRLERFTPPQNVKSAVKNYQEEEDIVGLFIKDCCVIGEGNQVQGGLLVQTYEQWCENSGINPLSKKAFGINMGKRPEFVKKKGNDGCLHYHGLGLLTQLKEPYQKR